MSTHFLKQTVGWGFGLWLFGYLLGFFFFPFLPANLIGWVIMPFGIAFTLWVLQKKITLTTIRSFLVLATVWTALAVILDYIFILQLLKPADGYYKTDVYLYYLLTFVLPLLFGLRKNRIKAGTTHSK
jgi:hypothetical protein